MICDRCQAAVIDVLLEDGTGLCVECYASGAEEARGRREE